MKRTTLSFVCVVALTLLLPMSVQGRQHHRGSKAHDDRRAHAAAVTTHASVHRSAGARARGHSHFRTRAQVSNNHARSHNRTHVAQRGNKNVIVSRHNTHIRGHRERNLAKHNHAGERNRVAVHHPKRNNGNLGARQNRARNAKIVNHWRGERFRGKHYAAFRNYHREWHSRHWWHRHYDRIVFVLGGWWFWDAGYWYPAWGYSSSAYYPYNGPIYTGYATLTPYQVTLNVQIQLQRDGYYAGPIDGILGPITREALAGFQADHGLVITSAIDEPTLATLGLT